MEDRGSPANPSNGVEKSPQVSATNSSSSFLKYKPSEGRGCISHVCSSTSHFNPVPPESCSKTITSDELPNPTLYHTDLAASNNNAGNHSLKKNALCDSPTAAAPPQQMVSISQPPVTTIMPMSSGAEPKNVHQTLASIQTQPSADNCDYSNYIEPESTLIKRLKETLDRSILDISACIRPTDLSALVRDVKQIKLIPKRVMEDLAVMHPSISMELRCRYLMLYIGKAIKEGEESDQNYLLNSLCTVMRRYLSYDQLNYCIESTRAASEMVNCVLPLIRTQTEKVPFCPERHLGIIFEKLSSNSHLWEDIGMALYFTGYHLQQIKAECASFSNPNLYKCLHRLLEAWMNRKYEYVKPATLSSLQEALRSETVGLGKIANEIEDVLKSTVIPQTYSMHCASYKNSSFICTHSDDIAVEESENETAVLLGVKLGGLNPHNIDYTWTKDGKVLKNLDTELDFNKHKKFENTDSVLGNSILCIRIVDICAEGKYNCICTFGDNVIESDVISISVKTELLTFKAQLVTHYNTEHQVKMEEDDWPPVHLDKFVNLAVVGGEGARLSEKCYQQTIQGNADDVFSSKANIEYQEAFRDIDHGDRVLVVGRPGSGKTTLVHKVSKDWARGSVLGKCKALFLVCLRGFDNNPDIKLDDLVNCYFDSEDVAEICRYIRKGQGLGACFILDGLDEYQPEKSNFIFDLIKLKALPHATVIVASRPAAVSTFVKFSKWHIEVLGFFKEQIEDYINCYNFNSDLQRSNLKTYLTNHPNIHHMCYLPIQTAMVCFLFDVCGDTLPNTETGIYSEFTKQTVLRALHRNKGARCRLQSLENLQDKEKSILLDICKLAYEMTTSSRQVIKQETAETFLNTRKIEDSLGLITVDEKATNCGFQYLYSFCHLTFQEFLAAYHISRLEVHDQLAIIESYGPVKHMYMVFKFYCGLAQFEETYIRFKTLMDVAKFSTLHTVQCCFESQQPHTCDLVADKNIIRIDSDFKRPSDYTCLGYVVISATRNPVRMIECCNISVCSECIEAYILATKSAENACKPVTMWASIEDYFDRTLEAIEVCPSLLKLSSNSHIPSFDSVASHSNNYLSLFRSTHGESSLHKNCGLQRLEILTISYALKCDITDPFEELEDGYLCIELSIFNCSLCNDGAALLAEGLKYSTSVAILKLVANNIGDEGAIVIAGSIEGCSSLYYLDLSLNQISDKGATALVNSIEGNFIRLFLFGNKISVSLVAQLESKNSKELFHTLNIADDIGDEGLARINSLMKELSLSYSTLEPQQTLCLETCGNDVDGIKLVANILSRFTFLYSLSLIKMNVGEESVKLLINSLLWENLHILDLSCNSIGPEGTTHLCQALQGISHQILTLNLRNNGIGVEGALALTECLQRSQSLCELDLSYNDIQDTGTEAICESLRNGNKLQVLNLASNSIGARGCSAVALLLEQNGKSLITLNLSCNRLIDVEAVCLARGFKCCSSLQKLYLNDNCIGDIGVQAIAEVLKNSDLTKLVLKSNLISNKGAVALGCCLQSCSELTTLNLSTNKIEDDGAISLGSGLRHCSKFHKLLLNYNSISGSGAIRLAEELRHCQESNILKLGLTL